MSVIHKTSLSTKGQIVIPAKIRKKLELKPGTKFIIYDLQGKLVLVPEISNPINYGLGFLTRKSNLEE